MSYNGSTVRLNNILYNSNQIQTFELLLRVHMHAAMIILPNFCLMFELSIYNMFCMYGRVVDCKVLACSRVYIMGSLVLCNKNHKTVYAYSD